MSLLHILLFPQSRFRRGSFEDRLTVHGTLLMGLPLELSLIWVLFDITPLYIRLLYVASTVLVSDL